MKISDVKLGTQRPDVLRRKAVERSESAGARAAASESSELKGALKTDRLEISEAARESSESQREIKREIEFARRAMYNIPPMSKERAEDLLKRLEQGYYNAPDVRMKLSQNLANAVAPGSAQAGSDAGAV